MAVQQDSRAWAGRGDWPGRWCSLDEQDSDLNVAGGDRTRNLGPLDYRLPELSK